MSLDSDYAGWLYERHLDDMQEVQREEAYAAYQEYLEELSMAEEDSETTPVLELCKQFLAVKPEDFQDTPLRGIEGKYLILEIEGSEHIIYISENRIRIYLKGFKKSVVRLGTESLQEFLGRIKADFVAEWTNHIIDTIKDLQNEVYYFQNLRKGTYKLLGVENPNDIPF